MFLAQILFALMVSVQPAADNANAAGDMVIGERTRFAASLLHPQPGLFYGLQLTPRGRRACQVRAFFRGAPPQAAQFCSGRVIGRHVRKSAVAVTGYGAQVSGISACLTRRGHIGTVRLHLSDGDFAIARFAECAGSFAAMECEGDWAVQGVQLFFDGADDGRAHRNLRGIRPLCMAMPEG